MTTQPSLFGLFEEADKQASASKHQDKTIRSQQRKDVYEFIKSKGVLGVADAEGIAHFKPTWSTVENAYRARRGELADDEWIAKHPVPRSINGRTHTVWIDATLLDSVLKETPHGG